MFTYWSFKGVLLVSMWFSFKLFKSIFSTHKGAVDPIANESSVSFQQVPIKTTLVNDIVFHHDSLSKYAYGNGFLVRYQQDTFAITAKHILTLAKSENMKTVQLGKEIKMWQMHEKGTKKQAVTIDALLNASATDSLDWGFMAKQGADYADWLVFSIKENSTEVEPLVLRDSPLTADEPLFVNGWTFEDTTLIAPRYEYRYHGEFGANFTMMPLNTRENEFGLSGSPVTDKNGQLVGIVSMTTTDSITKKKIECPF